MFLLLSWCSITLDFQSQSLLQLGRCPPELCHVKWFHLKKRGGKKTTLFSKTAIWQDSSQCFYPPPSNFPFRSPLHSHYVAADRSHMQELEYSDRPNVLAAAEFSAWLIPFLHPTSSPPPRSFRLIPPLAAVICYSYFLCSGKLSFRLFLKLKWNRSYIVLKVLAFSTSCLAAFPIPLGCFKNII